MKKKAIIHVITGDGKGKTTAALGLALRAIGAAKKVIVIQFMKKGDYAEHRTIKKYKLPIKVESYGIGFYKILGDKHTDTEHQKAAQKALDRAREVIVTQKYDLVILDEVNVASDLGLIDINELIEILDQAKSGDIILTGRNASPKLKKIADLVSEIKKVKHYFDQGIEARKGIEY